jgi:hypothetical protein
MTATTQGVGTVEAVVEAANNAYIIRNPLVAAQKGSRVAVVDRKVSTLLICIAEDMDWVID